MLEPGNPSVGAYLNVAGFAMLLDELVVKSERITPFLHTRLAATECDRPGHVTAVIVADKSGLRRLRGRFFIDATGDADLCRFCGLAAFRPDYCAQSKPSQAASFLTAAGSKYGASRLNSFANAARATS